MPILPTPPEDQDRTTTSFRLPKALLEDLRAISAAEDLFLNDVVLHFLRYAVDAWKEEKAHEKKGKK